MDWTAIITSLVSALAAAGGLGGLFHLRETRRAKRLENDRTAAGEWKELYERSEQKTEALGQKLDRTFASLRSEQQKTTRLEVSLARAAILRCDKTPCTNRHPPFGEIEPKTAELKTAEPKTPEKTPENEKP